MMYYVAKPNLNNKTDMAIFTDMEEAVTHLENKTGHKMDFIRDKTTGKRVYDWELIGKLIPTNNVNFCDTVKR